ncbi:hypothetical protein POTOM_047795 [Populus tomentosa]|uniref:Uncharacterized protein n=1 Tax=Populus tomentosa TaxID=118781 RepID=A0A8X8C9Z1_POPTO|nr:hypothetical protein POTOM_047795 [Populus tomentosa]
MRETLKDNAEICSPYFSFDTQDYHRDNAGIHSGTFFHQDNIVENPYNAEHFVEQDILQNAYNEEKLIQREKFEELYNASAYKPSDKKEILHFTDLVRSSLSFNHPVTRSDEPIGKFYSATKLHEAAINFKEIRNECLLDVKFTSTKGELRIPRLQIDHHTEYLFGNLIALERCHYKGEECISHYVKLLHTLVAAPNDVALLIKNKIIDTDRDGASVKNLIDKLSAETSEEYSIYYTLYKQLDQHYQYSWAYFREAYFGNLWRRTATLSATVLLLFTLVQTICAVLSLR